jgi:hypothetical protein
MSTAADILSRLNPELPLHRAHIQALRDLDANGCRYANHDFDVRSAAYSAVFRTEVHPWEARWVEVMNAKFAAI